MSFSISHKNHYVIRFGILFAIMNLVNLSTHGQDKKIFSEDYKSSKSISLTGGLIGIGVGGELRADIPFNKWIVTGSVGYKGSGVQDSNYTYMSHTYKRIVYSDCQGPILKLGVGLKLKRWETTSNEFVAENLLSIENRTYETVYTYSGHYSDLPILVTRYLILEISSQPTGTFTKALTPTIAKKNVLVPDNNTYVSVIIRRLQQYKYINRTLIFDLGFTTGSNFDQTGVYINSFLVNRHFNFSFTFGAVRRFDKPDDFEDPFNGDGMYKWIFPFQATFGYSFNLPK